MERVRGMASAGDSHSQDILQAYDKGVDDTRTALARQLELMKDQTTRLTIGFSMLADHHRNMAKKWRFSWHLSMILVGAFTGLWVYEAYNFLNDLNKGGIC